MLHMLQLKTKDHVVGLRGLNGLLCFQVAKTRGVRAWLWLTEGLWAYDDLPLGCWCGGS